MPKKKVKKEKKLKKSVEKKTKISKIKKTQSGSAKPLNKNTYTPEEKIEIKKIKKQPTEKRLYEVKDFVVYPKHGVGKIIAVEKATIGQIEYAYESTDTIATLPIEFAYRKWTDVKDLNSGTTYGGAGEFLGYSYEDVTELKDYMRAKTTGYQK